MSTVLDFAEGPLFRIAWLFLILGLLRLVFLGARPIRPRPAIWLHRIASVVVHASLIVIALFHDGHLALWAGGRIPALPHGLSDGIVWAAIGSVAVLFVVRIRHTATRAATTRSDLLALALVGGVFLFGWFTSHPATSILPWEVARLLHVLSAEVLMIAIPLTRLSHLAWVPAAGKEVAHEGHPA